jgi:4-hydroxy 2-oxovalerate aldolase
MISDIKLLDCTLRDGGYYNNWDFETEIIQNYLEAMDAIKIDFVEIGFRSIINDSLKGNLAYSTDSYLKNLNIPKGLVNKIGVMINGSEIVNLNSQISFLKKMFKPKIESPVSLVRIACHVNEFKNCLQASKWLKDQGYLVGFNLMQIADCSYNEIMEVAKITNDYPIDVLYFADSMGSLDTNHLKNIIEAFQKSWKGELGIHTHDNIGKAVSNTVEAVKYGLKWVDSTVTGMGRGPGNAQTEYVVLALDFHKKKGGNLIKLLEVIEKYFKPLKTNFGWGTNPFYYLAGQYGIHPTYIQKMLQDKRYKEKDILAVMDFLKTNGGKIFNLDTLESARNLYTGK